MPSDASLALWRLAQDRRLPPSGIRVYMHLYFELTTHDYRAVKLVTLSKALGMHRGHVSRAIEELLDRGYLERDGRAWPGGPFKYRLHPNPPSLDEGTELVTPRER